MKTIIFEELIGKRMDSIIIGKKYNDSYRNNLKDNVIVLFLDDKPFGEFTHNQDCCEQVYIEEIHGDVEDLVGLITQAEIVSNEDERERGEEGQTWSFLKLATNNGSVTIRWIGSSNGYYSENVEFSKYQDEEDE